MKSLILFFLIVSFLTVPGISQLATEQTIICFTHTGESLTYKLTPPSGWIMDQNNADDQVLASFFPKGETWLSAVSVMYSNFQIYLENEKNMDERIQASIDDAIKTNPGIKIERKNDIDINNSLKAKVVYYLGATAQGDGYTSYFANAYVPTPEGTVYIILSSRNKDDFYKKIPAFEQLVKSYKFVESSK